MDVPMLILLGAVGGALRGLLEAYIRFREWRADRQSHRRLPAGHDEEPPHFAQYFDSLADPVAVVVHSAMGAGAAVLFGTTGQISGAYAAIVVGLSAPVILTQLGRIQAVGDAVTVTPSPPASADEAAAEVPSPSTPVTSWLPAPLDVTTAPQSAPAVAADPTPLRLPTASPAVDNGHPSALSSSSRDMAASDPQPNGHPASRSTQRGIDGAQETPRLPRNPTVSEEGTAL
ncbi:hypothetical protein [Streptomyces sp. V3I8]|uniref:hypothetical protein n=1 Tax=Streptomyces sp. V3I8 TaxID=3042279 RepID=UPI0027D87E64|nr:hypothetical protein [Streptomyces sp. V3I8]